MMSGEEGALQPSAPFSEPSGLKAGMEQPGAAAKASGSERSLFPLPFFACPAKKVGCSRPVKQRRDRICRAVENCNEAIYGLNWLNGHKDAPGDGILVDGLQQQVMARVDGLVQCQKPSGAIDHPEAALRSLLKGASPYDLGISNETLAPYQYDLVSVPQDIKGCPNLLDVLDTHDRLFLEQDRELMLKSATEVESLKLVPYWDPVLKHNKRAYYRLVRRLQQIGYFTYTLEPKCKIGVFFVWKSSRTKLRMITDARSANRLFKDPPSVSLMTGEGLGRIEVACGETVFTDLEAMDALSIYIGLSDVRDCFHRMRVPQWLAQYFAWEPVPAHILGLDGTLLDGVTLLKHDLVWPCAGSLCQGFSWSLFFAQRANEYQASLTRPLRDALLANDRGGPIVLNVGKVGTEDRFFYVYVDNLGVIGADRNLVELAMSELQDVFNGQGLELHGSEVTKDYVEALGCVLEGKEMRSRCNPRRLWRIHHGIKALLRRGRCSGKVLEIIIGHCTFLGLICRPILSIFHAVYPFIRKHYLEVASLWQTVREELQAFMGVSFLLVQDWWRPWNRMVTSSDSSLVGYGVCKSWWPKQLVAEVGRIQERSRFRRCDRHSARESALTAAGFHLRNKSWTLMDEKTLLALADEGWEVSDEFPEVPSGSLKRHLWSPVCWGKWIHDENIGVLEARTVYKAVKRLCMTRYGHDIRHVHLCDNLGVVLSIERCRSKNFKILKVVRCIAAYCLARNVHLSVRWIPSELNVSDEPSRVHDVVGSKLLVDLVRADDFESFSPQAPGKQAPHAVSATQASCNRHISSNTQACQAASKQKQTAELGLRDETGTQEEAGPKQGADFKLHDSAPSRCEGDRREPAQDRLGVEQYLQEAKAARGGGRDGQWKHFIRDEGRRKRKERSYLAKAAKKAATAKGGPADAADLAWKDIVGDSSGVSAGKGPVQHAMEGAGVISLEEEDQMLVELFNEKFKQGEGAHYGDYTLAALMDQRPEYGRQGCLKIPRSWRAMKGWRKLCPSRSRLAYPLAVWCGLSWRMVVHGHVSKALFNLLQVSTYHRPGSLLRLRKMGLVRPTAGVTGTWSMVTNLSETTEMSKVGAQDESILLDSDWLQFAPPMYKALIRGEPMDHVWNFTYPEYLKVFNQCAAELKIPVVPYQARHSGPSIDRATKVRDLEEVRKRGQWLTRQSVMRYEKAGRLAATWQRLSPSTQAACKSAERYIEDIMLGHDFPSIQLPA